MKVEACTVELNANGKTFTKDYEKKTLEVKDLLALLSNPDSKIVERALADYNYGQDLRAKSAVRQELAKVSAGPDKAIEKSIKAFMDMRATLGKPVTEEQAKAILGIEEAPTA